MDIKQAKENRKKFLAPYKEKFRKTETKKERSEIISKLIAIEPSHLTEPWILKEVVNWMRDRDSFDFLEKVFIKSPKKYASTEKQKMNQARGLFIQHKIDKIMTQEGVSEREACKRFCSQIDFEGDKYLGWDITDEDHELQRAIRQVYLKAKKQPERLLPWPYYGKDVEIDENGKVEIFGGR